MVNTDPVWIYWQQRFQEAVEGEEVRDKLWWCLKLLLSSHEENVKQKEQYYNELVQWDPDDPHTPLPPPGWHVDPGGRWIKELDGVNDLEGE